MHCDVKEMKGEERGKNSNLLLLKLNFKEYIEMTLSKAMKFVPNG